ncbi:bifunctional (p)ppGpp synthetase/guanosine-3',5'-bis(diphosphate) 3'-pyrophosphohydrolase [Candidatus Saganbacteria bacterium]|nr:bifunctional (p)ppGpp synthetase/guanosine-3',5'-bis(diphosphate) 3'-pyrophosphohydrolase [Candidatus Saganbacteria bacterium]
MTIDDLKAKLKYIKDPDLSLLDRVYKFAEEKHRNHKRLSGEPYISHPLAVASVLTDLEQDLPTICAALLHDTIEDSGVTFVEISEKFSPEIAKLVEGVTKLSQLIYESKEERQAENFRKMFMAMGEDLRVIVIKLADRLHNMQTLKYLSQKKIKETSLETREIFSPLAHRLGMWKLKWELEDLSFGFLEPDKYADIQAKVSESREAREAYIKNFVEKLTEVLKKVSLISDVYGRPKHLFSIYHKMVDQNLDFSEIYDLTAVRVIVESIKDCYAVLGIVHATWKPIPGRFRDYIAVPKSNGYQSLHTTVIGEEGKPVEVQIRTREMHRIAEYGVAAHWVYKEEATDKAFDKKMAWFRQMLETQTELKDAKDFLDSLKIDLFVDEVFVFTPKGQVIQMPIGATPIDFAYHVHTEVGHRTAGVKVNGRILPLDSILKNGDIVEIITSKIGNPSLDWLNFVKTSGARTKIKGWFRKVKRDESIERGRVQLEEELKKFRLHPKTVLIYENIKNFIASQKLKTEDDFFAAIGYGDISAYDIARKMHSILKPEDKEEMTEKPKTVRPRKRNIVHGVNVSGLTGVMVKMSKCCRPLPGDDIIGFVTHGKGVAVHRKDCATLLRNKPDPKKLVKVDWELSADIYYPVEIEIEAFDRVGALKDIMTQISETKTNVASAYIKTKRGSTAFLRIVVDVKNVDQLQLVMQSLRNVSDVYDVKRYDIIK